MLETASNPQKASQYIVNHVQLFQYGANPKKSE